MGGSSKTPSQTTQVVKQETLAPWAAPYAKKLLGRGQVESLQGYTPYSGQRIMPFMPAEAQAQEGIMGMARFGAPMQQRMASQVGSRLASGRGNYWQPQPRMYPMFGGGYGAPGGYGGGYGGGPGQVSPSDPRFRFIQGGLQIPIQDFGQYRRPGGPRPPPQLFRGSPTPPPQLGGGTPEGFIPPPPGSVNTMAFEDFYNPETGETHSVSSGGWTPPAGWRRGRPDDGRGSSIGLKRTSIPPPPVAPQAPTPPPLSDWARGENEHMGPGADNSQAQEDIARLESLIPKPQAPTPPRQQQPAQPSFQPGFEPWLMGGMGGGSGAATPPPQMREIQSMIGGPYGRTGGGFAPQQLFPSQQFLPGPRLPFMDNRAIDPSQSFNMGVAQRYMSPYQQAVTDIEKREARRESAQQGAGVGLEAARSGGLGGYREAIMQAERQRNLGQQLGDIQTRGLQGGYDRAATQLAADRGATLAAQQQQLSAAGMMGQLGAQEQSLARERLQDMEAAGQRQRAFQQAMLDVGYQDFQRQLGYPQRQMGFMQQLIHGLPIPTSVSESTYARQPGMFQTGLGLGLQGLGLYNAMQGGGGG